MTEAFAAGMKFRRRALGNRVAAVGRETRMRVDELRLVRQRPFLPAPANAPLNSSALDWFAFADKFRGREEDIRQRFTRYVPLFVGRQNVADLGCGRGEFLSLVPGARGIDFSQENVAFCAAKGLPVAQPTS